MNVCGGKRGGFEGDSQLHESLTRKADTIVKSSTDYLEETVDGKTTSSITQ